MILSAVYMLWMVQRVYYGEVTNEKNRKLPDLSVREWLVIAPVVRWRSSWACAPNVFLLPTAPAIDKVVERRRSRQMQVAAASSGSGAPSLSANASGQPPIELMLDSSFAAIVPMVCVTLAALAAMVAESFRGKGEQMPIGTLGVIGLSFGLVGSMLLWGRNASSFGMIRADNFGALRQHHPLHRRAVDDCAVRSDDSPRGSAGGRVLHADALLDRRHDDDGRRPRIS